MQPNSSEEPIGGFASLHDRFLYCLDSVLPDKFPYTPFWEGISSHELPEEVVTWGISTFEYFSQIGIRFIPPAIYLSIQGLAISTLMENTAVSNLEQTEVIGVLVGSHVVNFLMEYLVFRSGGTPINILSPSLRRVIDRLSKADINDIYLSASAVGVIASKLAFIEASKLSTVIVNDTVYKIMGTTTSLILLFEAVLNGSILLQQLFTNDLNELLVMLESSGNISF